METSQIKRTVILDFEMVGFHKWANAPEPVKFLSNDHRHNFRFRLGYKVIDADREIEIFMEEEIVQHYLTECYGSPLQFEGMSCEMIAEDLLIHFQEEGCIWVEVFEDNKGGARVDL